MTKLSDNGRYKDWNDLKRKMRHNAVKDFMPSEVQRPQRILKLLMQAVLKELVYALPFPLALTHYRGKPESLKYRCRRYLSSEPIHAVRHQRSITVYD